MSMISGFKKTLGRGSRVESGGLMTGIWDGGGRSVEYSLSEREAPMVEFKARGL